jgi:hypothetical protein
MNDKSLVFYLYLYVAIKLISKKVINNQRQKNPGVI